MSKARSASLTVQAGILITLISIGTASRAGTVDPTQAVVIAVHTDANGRILEMLFRDGTRWTASTTPNAPQPGVRFDQDLNAPPLPIPIEEILFWTPSHIISKSAEVWFESTFYGSRQWINGGRPPAAPVAQGMQSAGKLKSRFK